MKVILKAGPFSFSCQQRKLYENVNIILYENDFVHLKGPSGTGKSTLLRQIVGLEKYAQNVKRILSNVQYPPRNLTKFRSQCVYLDPECPMLEGSLRENLLFPYQFKVNCHRQPTMNPEIILKKLGLSQNLDTETVYLSTGEKERLSLVRALLFNPQVILADEPFSGLDSENFEITFELLYEFSQRPGKAVLYVSHAELPKKTKTLFLNNGELKEIP
ncbi:ABC transporter ATP-binding protein [Thermodesulfatator indicus]